MAALHDFGRVNINLSLFIGTYSCVPFCFAVENIVPISTRTQHCDCATNNSLRFYASRSIPGRVFLMKLLKTRLDENPTSSSSAQP